MAHCDRYRTQLNDYLDGALDAGHAIALAQHLEACPACRKDLAGLKATQALLRSAPVPDGTAARRAALASLRTVAPVTPAYAGRSSLWKGAFASTVLAGITLLLLMPQPVSTPEIGRSGTRLTASVPTPGDPLPSASELMEMNSLHAAESFSVSAAEGDVQQAALADANANLRLRKP